MMLNLRPAAAKKQAQPGRRGPGKGSVFVF